MTNKTAAAELKNGKHKKPHSHHQHPHHNHHQDNKNEVVVTASGPEEYDEEYYIEGRHRQRRTRPHHTRQLRRGRYSYGNKEKH